LKLKNVSIQDINNFIIVSEYAEMDVLMKGGLPTVDAHGEITDEMRKGKRPAWLNNNASRDAGSGVVLLVHGYCSAGNPWSCCMGDWSNADYVNWPSESVSNDQFARKIDSFAKSKGLTGYSVVGYSQGGMAVAHLHNFYWSGMDLPVGGRIIQSLVTPFGGTSIAGSSAGLGKVFGVGCGANNDLTHDGANLWSRSVATSTRKEIYSYIVQYGDNGFNTRYCNNVVNMMLNKPNDGTTEVDYAILSGTNYLGLTVGQCHTKNMKYPPAFEDHNRNRQMNSYAAR